LDWIWFEFPLCWLVRREEEWGEATRSLALPAKRQQTCWGLRWWELPGERLPRSFLLSVAKELPGLLEDLEGKAITSQTR